ncbi:MAG: ethanolamine ammonia-lyase subunit EutB, partial [Bacteroidota bacterium]
ARVQPNSPTDHPEDVFWQVMNAWSFAVGDVVLGTNPVSSDPVSVALLEKTLHDILITFELEQVMPHCVLAHIDIQSQVEEDRPGTTGIWFQSIAGTDDANGTFDVSLEKMQLHASRRNGKYGLYAETGQGADETNGHGSGFDMLFHESRKYGMMRGLKKQILQQKPDHEAWVHVNDVAGFIGPEVFRTREQLVRCCLEDIVMGKLHGLTIGLDICTTLHMDVSLSDLDWCIDRIMPANPAYLMALPTKNDPMLSYLTTSFVDHVRIREKFGYKVNDAMWDFFKSIDIIGADNQPTAHFADPVWVYYQYLKRKGDTRTWTEIEIEGKQAIERVRERGVPVATGHGENTWDLKPELDAEIRTLYEDAKMCIWREWPAAFYPLKENNLLLETGSIDRKDYIYHPQSGERLSTESDIRLKAYAVQFPYDYQVVLSDGLNVLSLTDDEHLAPFLEEFNALSAANGFLFNPQLIQLKNGRVRAGYEVGKTLFKNKSGQPTKGIIHLIGERPGTRHRSYSVYLTLATVPEWSADDKIDHNITRVISGISNTSLLPRQAAKETTSLIRTHLLSKRN